MALAEGRLLVDQAEVPWSRGGRTDLKGLRLRCPHHHARAHDPTYEMVKIPDGKVRFHRPT